jgi:hypothetical protein
MRGGTEIDRRPARSSSGGASGEQWGIARRGSCAVQVRDENVKGFGSD